MRVPSRQRGRSVLVELPGRPHRQRVRRGDCGRRRQLGPGQLAGRLQPPERQQLPVAVVHTARGLGDFSPLPRQFPPQQRQIHEITSDPRNRGRIRDIGCQFTDRRMGGAAAVITYLRILMATSQCPPDDVVASGGKPATSNTVSPVRRRRPGAEGEEVSTAGCLLLPLGAGHRKEPTTRRPEGTPAGGRLGFLPEMGFGQAESASAATSALPAATAVGRRGRRRWGTCPGRGTGGCRGRWSWSGPGCCGPGHRG
ncbi:hypothetical protein BCF44_13318 [Kutzneria buriramensis]|uniref:Uncharacterized protein n=1 Tax=Kutzneria buriramensis TaxID=1045776 RepID=A0A3E0GT69_9PSEU|nr:hypothetical protein BCF44_13318 [Kutzneria buriramensis]